MKTNFKNSLLINVLITYIFVFLFNSSSIAQGEKKAVPANKQIKTKDVSVNPEPAVPVKIERREKETRKTVDANTKKATPISNSAPTKK